MQGDKDFDRTLVALRDRTGIVVLDIEPHNAVAGKGEVASQIASEQLERRRAGTRCAWLYPMGHAGAFTPDRDLDWHLCIGVTREQARQLMAAGGKWIGQELDAP